MRFMLSDKRLRNRMLEEIRALRYPPDGGCADLVDEMIREFANQLRDREHEILEELLATKKNRSGSWHGAGRWRIRLHHA